MAHETLSAGEIQSHVRARRRVARDRDAHAQGRHDVPGVGVGGAAGRRSRAATHVVSVEQDISEERRLREQLIHSERLSAVGQLVAGVAHEINNPLQAVMGFTELLIEAEDRPQVRADLEQIRVDAGRAAKIVRHLLLFARRSTLERSVADLNEIARSTLRCASFELRAGQIAPRAGVLDGAAADRRQPRGGAAGHPQPAAERGARDPRHAAGPASIRVRTGHDERRRRSSKSPTTDPGCRPRRRGGSSSRSSRPRASARAPGSGCRSASASREAHGGALRLMPSERGAWFRLTLPSASSMQASAAAGASEAMPSAFSGAF